MVAITARLAMVVVALYLPLPRCHRCPDCWVVSVVNIFIEAGQRL
jgi:hypothetical protein